MSQILRLQFGGVLDFRELDRFSLDTLINPADRAGLPVSLQIGQGDVVA